MSEPTYLESSDADAGGFAALLAAPPDWFFAAAGSWARLTGEIKHDRHKKESRTKNRILGFIRMKCFPPDAQVRNYAAFNDCEPRTVTVSTALVLFKSEHIREK